MSEDNSGSTGIGIGSVVAVAMSWSANHSVFWAFVHGLLGWAYVIYRICGCGE